MSGPLKVLFAAPAYYPALAFGGPIWAALELNKGAVEQGYAVEVLTTSLVDVRRGLSLRTRTDDVSGVQVHYLATPVRYRWMGITPTLPIWLRSVRAPDVAHLFGFRDPVTTTIAAWCRSKGIPYVFEPLGMFEPRVRKLRLKWVFDRTVARHVARNAAVILATSEHERRRIIAAGAPPAVVEVRGNGFPRPEDMPAADGSLRRRLGIGDAPLILYVGRLASGKGIDHLLAAMRSLPGAHLVVAGPDDGHGVLEDVLAASRDPVTAGRVHRLEPRERPLSLYAEADAFALPSGGESFGMVAAEAAAAGTPVLVTDRCGVTELLGDAALVVPYERDAIRQGLARLLEDAALREHLHRRGPEVARLHSWAHMVERQHELYHLALERR